MYLIHIRVTVTTCFIRIFVLIKMDTFMAFSFSAFFVKLKLKAQPKVIFVYVYLSSGIGVLDSKGRNTAIDSSVVGMFRFLMSNGGGVNRPETLKSIS